MLTPDSPRPNDVASDDESVRVDIAVRALGDMRSRAEATASSSGEGRPSSPSSERGEQDENHIHPASSRDFVARMTSFPLVGTAIWAYEQGKASSKVVKYGAQMVESSVKTISKPVMNRLPVSQIDEFACRQLDKFDKYRCPSVGSEPIPPRSPVSPSRSSSISRRMSDLNDAGSSTSVDLKIDPGRPRLATKTFDGTPAPECEGRSQQTQEEGIAERGSLDGGDRNVPHWTESSSSHTHNPASEAASPMDDSGMSSPILLEDRRASSALENQSPDQQTPQVRQHYPNSGQRTDELQPSQVQIQNADRQVVQRSRWQAMLLEAGGLGVALSDENMRRLKYCLNWLLYATAHIDAQILILRDFMESIQPIRQPSSTQSHRRPPISEEQLRKLTEVRKDIVSTVRQMVDVVSKYAGGALPEPARGRVRGFILKLPQRWATRAAAAGIGASAVGNASSTPGGNGERERETVAAAGRSTGVHRRGQGRDKRAAQRERGTSSRAPSPTPQDASHSPHSSHSGPTSNQHLSHSNATVAAQRILSLATESLDMMRNVTGVVKDSLDRADAWVNRLRIVGVHRGNQNTVNDDALNEEFGPPRVGSQHDTAYTHRDEYRALFQNHRRVASTSSIPGEEETSFASSSPGSPLTTTTSLGYLSNSSYTAASSMPSTPTCTSFSSLPSASVRDYYNGAVANAPSPGTIPFASMHITSRFNTPKSGVANLPVEDDELENRPDGSLPLRKLSLPMEVDS